MVDEATIDKARADLGELPAAQVARLQAQYGLSEYDANVIARQGRAFVAYFEQTAGLCGDAKETSNWITNEVLQSLNLHKLALKDYLHPAADRCLWPS